MSTVSALRPEAKGLTLTVKVVDAKVVVDRPRGPKGSLKVAEAIVGDSTGVVILTAKNEQANTVVKGATLTLKNAKVEMFRGSMRLSADTIETTDQDVKPNVDNNVSLIEFELITLPAAGAQ